MCVVCDFAELARAPLEKNGPCLLYSALPFHRHTHHFDRKETSSGVDEGELTNQHSEFVVTIFNKGKLEPQQLCIKNDSATTHHVKQESRAVS